MSSFTEYEQAYIDLLDRLRTGFVPAKPYFDENGNVRGEQASGVEKELFGSRFPEMGAYRVMDDFRVRFGYAILTAIAVSRLKKYGAFLEVGAGTGYWAYEMRKAGIDIVATDIEPGNKNSYKLRKTWIDVEKLEAKAAIAKYPDRTLLTVWPSYAQDWTGRMIKAYSGPYVVYCGEGDGGCTGDEKFHRILGNEKVWKLIEMIRIPQWPGLHDRIEIFKRI